MSDLGTSGQTADVSARCSSASARRERTASVHRWTRFAIQVLFLVLAPGAFSGAFNAVKYLFAQIGAVQGFEMTSFAALLVAVLGFTVVFGRFFCGYACAFGTLGDIVYAIGEFFRSKTPIPRIAFPERLVKTLSLVKYAVLAGICSACVFGVWQDVSGMSPWVAFAGFTSGSFEGIRTVAFALLAATAVGMLVRERFFCQFLCPLGAVFSLLPVLGFSEFKRVRAHCAKNCGRCHRVCPVDIWPDVDTLGHGECIGCGRCADACPLGNVNSIALERGRGVGKLQAEIAAERNAGSESGIASRPLLKTKKAWRLVRGNETGVVLCKAVLLLLALWLAGATRYLPSVGF